MERLTELRQQRTAVVKKMRKLHDESKDNFTEEEDTEYKSLQAKITVIDAEIEREEELREMEGINEDPENVEVRVIIDEDDKKTQEGVWAHLGEQLDAVRRAEGQPGGVAGVLDPRLTERAVTGMSEGAAQDGGFLVQTDFSSELLKKAVDAAVLAPRCRRIGIGPNANGLKMNAIDDSSRVEGSRWGGVRTYWEGEGDQLTASQIAFTQMEWKLKKLTGLSYATEELLQDTIALGQVMSEAFSEEFSFKIDDAIFRGTGSGQPLGILNAPARVEVLGSGGAATFTGTDAIAMRARMWARSRPNSIWLYNQDIEPQLHRLNILGDGSVSEFLIYMPAGGISGQPFDTLFGRQMIPIEQASTLGTAGDIELVDLSQYLLIDKGGLKSDVSIHVRFLFDEMAFRFILRIDGQPLWPSALTPAQGTNTLSPFIGLNTRS